MRLFFLFLLLIIYSCSDECEHESFDLIGKWTLIESCSSIGADCTPKKVDFIQTFEFMENGEFIFEGVSLSCRGLFSVNENVISFNETNDCLEFPFHFDIVDMCSITINPSCFETCYFKYVKGA